MVILLRLPDQVEAAHAAFTLFVMLTMFTIWVEPWLTESGGLMIILSYALKLTVFAVMDLVASVLWFSALHILNQSIKSEIG